MRSSQLARDRTENTQREASDRLYFFSLVCSESVSMGAHFVCLLFFFFFFLPDLKKKSLFVWSLLIAHLEKLDIVSLGQFSV